MPSLEEDYLKWRKGTEVGCLFARLIAGNPAKYKQKLCVVAQPDPVLLAEGIAARVQEFVADEAVAAAVILMPELPSVAVLAQTALALAGHENWFVAREPLLATPGGDVLKFSLTRTIPFGATTCPSEILVLGPWLDFPETRRAPIAAMELFVGSPRTEDPKSGKPTTKANLAHLEVFLPSHKAFLGVWAKSEEGRLESLGRPVDDRAKAKVSFIVPKATAEQLGIWP